MKLRTRMLLNILGIVAVIIVSIVVLIGIQTRNNMTDVGNELVKEQAEKLASHVEQELNHAMDTARTLAFSLSGMREIGELNRDYVNSMLHSTLENNSKFYAVWSAWEPNAFDGNDELYVLSEGTDESGRFISYWYRDGERLSLQALENYDVPGEGDFYLLARNSEQDIILEPYEYNFNGQMVLVTSLVSPIKVNGTVVGAVGIDITMNQL